MEQRGHPDDFLLQGHLGLDPRRRGIGQTDLRSPSFRSDGRQPGNTDLIITEEVATSLAAATYVATEGGLDTAIVRTFTIEVVHKTTAVLWPRDVSQIIVTWASSLANCHRGRRFLGGETSGELPPLHCLFATELVSTLRLC